MKNYVQKGDTLTLTVADVTDAVAISAGDGYVVGSLFGVAQHDVAVGDSGEFAIVGVFDLAKVSAQAWTAGVAIYWDAAAGNATTSSGVNTLIGKAVLAADNPSSTGRVRLDG
jgi:predicted RecA/RadA family phage recombinase